MFVSIKHQVKSLTLRKQWFVSETNSRALPRATVSMLMVLSDHGPKHMSETSDPTFWTSQSSKFRLAVAVYAQIEASCHIPTPLFLFGDGT